MSSQDLNRRRRKIWFWGILALCILFILCLWSHNRSIPRDIESRVRAALTVGGFDPGLLSVVDGRDVSLAGEIDQGSDRNKPVAIARSVRGVRRASDNLTLIELGVAHVSIVRSDGRLVLKGELADQNSVDKLLVAARQLVGVNDVDSQLTVGENIAPSDWIDGLIGLFPALEDIPDARVDVGGEGFLIGGTLDAAEKRSALLQNARKAAGKLALLDRTVLVRPKQIDNRIEVKPITPPPAVPGD